MLLSRLTLGLGSNVTPRGGGTPTPTPAAGATATDFTSTGLTPDLHYHPNTQTVMIDGSNRLTAVTGSGVSPNLTPSATGPEEQTDLNGIKRWRFEGAHYLDVPNTFVSTPRALTIFIVGRIHRPASTLNLFGLNYQSDGTTVANTSGAVMRSVASSSAAPYLYSSAVNSAGASANANKMVLGSQLQVFGMASRTTANGALRFYMNGEAAPHASQSSSAFANCQGARIGGYLFSNGTTNIFDLYEIAVFKGELTNVQADAVAAALVDNWGVVPFTKNIVVEGDSIVQGIIEISSGDSLAMEMTEPGLGLLAADVRVISMGVSGATVATCTTRRDAANGWPTALLSGGAANNILSLQIGRNDTAAPATGAAVYDTIKVYHNEATTGVLARGWSAVQMANIACDAGATSTDLYGLIKANFATDVAGGSVIDLQAIEVGGFLPFIAANRNGTYYQDNDGSLDDTHPSELGTEVMATGGDTPQHGYCAIL